MPDSPATQPWLQFKTSEVRQLAFCIASPPLLQHWPDGSSMIDLPDHQFWLTHFQRYLPRLKQLDVHPAPLLQHLHTLRSTRLGIRFESLLAFWLLEDDYHPYKVIGHSIKRMQGNRTLGELDFVLLNRQSGHIEHWEVAIKFYLGEACFLAGEAEGWVGLNRRDTLGRKLQHLQTHQFNVSSIEGYPIDRQRAIIKGRLFYPRHQTLPAPSWIAPGHLYGTWGHALPALNTDKIWRRAQRLEWLCEHEAESPSHNPHYWTDGLYFLMQNDQVESRYMLRAHNLIHKYI